MIYMCLLLYIDFRQFLTYFEKTINQIMIKILVQITILIHSKKRGDKILELNLKEIKSNVISLKNNLTQIR